LPRIVETLKREFRDFMRKVTHRAPEPKPRRRRRGETRRSFQVSARKITRTLGVLTPLAYSNSLPDWDVLKWLQQWAECNQACDDDDIQSSERPADSAPDSAGLFPEP
jgi:hypothetical protein